MSPWQYRGCEIIRTNMTTTVRRTFFGRDGLKEQLRPIYAIRGRVNKPAGLRPFITSIAEAKEWIEEELFRIGVV